MVTGVQKIFIPYVKMQNFAPHVRISFPPSLSPVDLRGARHLLTSQHSLPGIPLALKQSIDLRTSMDGKYKEIAEVSADFCFLLTNKKDFGAPNVDIHNVVNFVPV